MEGGIFHLKNLALELNEEFSRHMIFFKNYNYKWYYVDIL